jgi:hypothetical protein
MKTTRDYFIWAAGLALLTTSTVFACKCIGVPSPSVAFAEADEVFAGTVIDIAPVSVDATTGEVIPDDPRDGPVEQAEETQSIMFPMNQVKFQVAESWKGSNTITRVVLTGRGGGDCGYPFEQGSGYLVYAYGGGGALGATGVVHICSPTTTLSPAAVTRQLLGTGLKPVNSLLNVRREHGTTILSWQTNWTGFRLEATESLRPPVVWQPVSSHVGVAGGFHVVTNEASSLGSFYRLVR